MGVTGITTANGENDLLQVGIGVRSRTWSVALFFSNITPTEDTDFVNYTEVSGGGYARKALTPANITITAGDPATATHPDLTWTFSSAVGNIYGWALVDEYGYVKCINTFPDGPINIDAAGKQVILAVSFSLRDRFDRDGAGFRYANGAEDRILQNLLRKRTSETGVYTLKFYTNNVTPSETSVAGDFTAESSASFTLRAAGATSPNMVIYGQSPTTDPARMTWNGTPNPLLYQSVGYVGKIYGYFIVDALGDLVGAEKFAVAYDISIGDKISFTPRFSFCDLADT